MDNCRTVNINLNTIREFPCVFRVEIQRGSLVPDGEIKYVRKFQERTENAYGIKHQLSNATKERLAELFDGWDGESRPENVNVEFYLGTTKLTVNFSIDGRLNKD